MIGTLYTYKRMFSIALMMTPLLLLTDLSGFIDFNSQSQNHNSLISSENKEKNNIKNPNEKYTDLERKYLLESYQNAVVEIQKRVEHEHLLFVLKFTLVGAVLGILFKSAVSRSGDSEEGSNKSKILPPEIFCWAAIAVSAILDVRMLVNLGIIIDLGQWVGTLERDIMVSGVSGWETHFSKSPLFTTSIKPFLLMDRQLLTGVLYLITMYQFIENREQSIKSSCAPFFLCIILFGFVGLHFYYRIDNGLLFYIPFFFVVMAISCAGCNSIKVNTESS